MHILGHRRHAMRLENARIPALAKNEPIEIKRKHDKIQNRLALLKMQSYFFFLKSYRNWLN